MNVVNQMTPEELKRELQKSPREADFLGLWHQYAPNFPNPVNQYRFHPRRLFRLDFAWPTFKVAVEVDGGTHTGGRHVTGKGYADDCEKRNLAIFNGWRMYNIPSDTLKQNPAPFLDIVKRTIRQAEIDAQSCQGVRRDNKALASAIRFYAESQWSWESGQLAAVLVAPPSGSLEPYNYRDGGAIAAAVLHIAKRYT